MLLFIGSLIVIFGLCIELEQIKRDLKGGRR